MKDAALGVFPGTVRSVNEAFDYAAGEVKATQPSMYNQISRWVKFLSAGCLFMLAAVSALEFGMISPSFAQEAISLEEPPPDSVHGITTPIERSFTERPPRPGFSPWLKDQLKDLPPFFRDTEIALNLRNYYFQNGNYDDSVNSAWTTGGALSYKSGWLLDRLRVGTTFYWSDNLYGPKDKDGTHLLKPGQHGYSVVGQLYGRVKLFEDHIVNLYRYEYDTPFINKNDSRMTPNTFEGYTIQGLFGDQHGGPSFRYGGGYVTKIKAQNSDEFVWMSRQAGADVKRGVGVFGGLFSYDKFSLGAINYYSKDLLNIFYTEAKYSFSVTKDVGARLAFQYADQRSVGDNLLKARSFTANQLGVIGNVSYGGLVFTLGYTNTLRLEDMQSPWSSYPGYTAAQVQDFDRAKEQALMIKLSFDFSRLGLQGVTVYGLFVHAWGRRNPSNKTSVPNENEFDADLQWRPAWSFLKGFSARLRYARVRQYKGPRDTQDNYRVILNYDWSLL